MGVRGTDDTVRALSSLNRKEEPVQDGEREIKRRRERRKEREMNLPGRVRVIGIGRRIRYSDRATLESVAPSIFAVRSSHRVYAYI